MANIVELREMSDDKLTERLENAREEMFNLRFQKATAQLDNHDRIKIVRREIAQLESVKNMRQLAIAKAAAEPAIAKALAATEWLANAHFDYEESAWLVNFSNPEGRDLASARVDLNQKNAHGRKNRGTKGQRQPVLSYEVVG